MSNAPATGAGCGRSRATAGAARRPDRRQARDFLDGVSALATGEGGDETVPLLLLEVSQILLAGAQLGASKDVILPGNWEPDVGADPDLDELRTGLAARLRGLRRLRRDLRPLRGHPADARSGSPTTSPRWPPT